MVPAENNEISVSGNDDISSEAAASDTTVSDTENEEIYDEDAFISDESESDFQMMRIQKVYRLKRIRPTFLLMI